jgi:ferredoxin-NADP reductase
MGLQDRLRVVAVARTWAELPYAAELQRYGAFIALTRENLGDRVAAPPYHDELAPYLDGVERAYVCGSVGFASYATRLLEESGIPADTIRVEQFGESG